MEVTVLKGHGSDVQRLADRVYLPLHKTQTHGATNSVSVPWDIDTEHDGLETRKSKDILGQFSGVAARAALFGDDRSGSKADLTEPKSDFRGRDASYLAPPAQIRTGPIRAYGSHLGCLTANLPYALQRL